MTEVGDEQVLDAVLVEIGERDVRGVRNVHHERQPAVGGGRMAGEHEPLAHFGPDHIELPAAADMHELHVRHRRRVWRARQRLRMPREFDRRFG